MRLKKVRGTGGDRRTPCVWEILDADDMPLAVLEALHAKPTRVAPRWVARDLARVELARGMTRQEAYEAACTVLRERLAEAKSWRGPHRRRWSRVVDPG